MASSQRITIEPGKRSGQPCIRGLRITVYDILSLLAAGASEREILEHLSAHSPYSVSSEPAWHQQGALWAVHCGPYGPWPIKRTVVVLQNPEYHSPTRAGAVRSDASESLSDASISGSGARDAEPKNISS